MTSDHKRQVPPTIYGRDYFLRDCEGWREYSRGGLSFRLRRALELAAVERNERVLDIGCGRGESLAWVGRAGAVGVGIDYSKDAVELSHATLNTQGLAEHALVALGSAEHLPLADQSVDCVLMLDVVEHLYPDQLQAALREAHRVLVAGGRIVVHTAPNRWFYRWGYPVLRVVERLHGRRLPGNPRVRFAYHNDVHVNEQSPASLRTAMRNIGFATRIFVDDARTDWASMGGLSRALGRFATKLPGMRWIVCGDIYALGRRTDR